MLTGNGGLPGCLAAKTRVQHNSCMPACISFRHVHENNDASDWHTPEMSSPWLGCSTTVLTAARLSYSRWQPGARRSQILTAGPGSGKGRARRRWVAAGPRQLCRRTVLHIANSWLATVLATSACHRRGLAGREAGGPHPLRTRAVLAASVHPFSILLEPH